MIDSQNYMINTPSIGSPMISAGSVLVSDGKGSLSYLDTTQVSNNNKRVEDMFDYATPKTAKAGYGHAAATVNVAPAPTQEQETRDYFMHELKEAKYAISYTPLKRKFGLVQDQPKDGRDLVKFIKDGLFTLENDKWFEDSCRWYGALGGIKFGDPKIVEDRAGFTAAKSDIEKAYIDAKRTIMATQDGDAQLKAVTDFEATVKSIIG